MGIKPKLSESLKERIMTAQVTEKDKHAGKWKSDIKAHVG
jgi:hypothetical protein